MTAGHDHAELRRVFAAYPTGVAAVAALVGGTPAGIAASSFVSVSLDPPLVSVCVAHTSTTWPALRNARRLGISVLGAHQELAGQNLGTRGSERFATLSWRATGDGAVMLCGASAWLDCSIERHIPAGDHDIVLLRVHDLGASDAPPLVFHGSTFRQLRASTSGGDPVPGQHGGGFLGRCQRAIQVHLRRRLARRAGRAPTGSSRKAEPRGGRVTAWWRRRSGRAAALSSRGWPGTRAVCYFTDRV
jgi:flavin reductase (DIM6/NTAB) family NADH-FMN oxidoreductase RutF